MNAESNKPVISELLSQTDSFSTIQVMEFITERFGSGIVFSTGFGQEDQIITNIIFTKKLPISIFTIDTGRLFQDTYQVWDKTFKKYKEPIRAVFPEKKDVEQMISTKGPFSFYESADNRKECCNIRKVAPLKQALDGAACWITGIRAEQSLSRMKNKLFEWDENYQVVKCNPLINWTTNQVLDYIEQNNIPYNFLHDKGFISIGCEPCTRAVKKGEEIRSGRWWWEDDTKKECGLHR